MNTIAIANQKGGVGKTTTAVNLLASLALAGKKCLLIDLDAQANATTAVGNAKADSLNLENGLPAPRDTDFEDLCITPASPTYSSPAVAEALERAIQKPFPDDWEYDFVVFDCPPVLTGVTRAALNTAGGVIVPIQCEYFSLEGLDSVFRTIQVIRRQQNPDLKLLGILLTMYEPKQPYCTAVRDEVTTHFPNDVFDTVIPRNVALSEAASHGQPITVYAPRSPGCLGYVRLAKEVLNAASR